MRPKPNKKIKTAFQVGHRTPTLGDVLRALDGHEELSQTRLRDLRSYVKRVASLLGDDPARIPLDIRVIGAKLAATNPAATGLSNKSFSNIRSGFMMAVEVSGLKPLERFTKAPLRASWKELVAALSARRAHIALSRLARYASANGVDPIKINDAVIEEFITAVRDGTLHRKPNELHRRVAKAWNDVAQQSRFNLQCVNVPSFQRPVTRTAWTELPRAFREDVKEFLKWCAGVDRFAANARLRPLAPQTVKLRQNQIHAAVTALVESGVSPRVIRSLRDLVSPKNFKRILQRRYESVGRRENIFNRDLARALLEIARLWVKVDATTLSGELRRLSSAVPTPLPGLTDKNKKALRQFDDPAVLLRLYDLPNRLWAEVKRERDPDRYTLVKAQAAIAIGILLYMPIRLQNLAALTFDVHLFMKEARGAVSSLEVPADEVKNGLEIGFDIPADDDHINLAKILIEYRNRIAPKVIGRRPDRLFVKTDGTPKNQWAVAWMIRKYLRRRAGIEFSPHMFRHLSAKVVLDLEPGNFQTPRQLLGHRSERTTATIYAGISSRRAARHHRELVKAALAAKVTPRRQKRTS
jgi:integrase